jgi:hypothetical protein
MRVVDHVVADTTISVSHDHVMGAMTDAGPLRSWRVTIEGPGVSHTTLIGIASSSAEVSDGLVATIVEHGMLTTYPGSRDNDPFAAATVRTWIDENREALAELVIDLRN